MVANVKTFAMMENFFRSMNLEGKKLEVESGQSLSLGKHVLTFVFAPMVHWPEVMVTYDSTDKVLFAADGFGKFGALDVEEDWDDESRRYFIGIVGKYGKQVQNLLKELQHWIFRLFVLFMDRFLKKILDTTLKNTISGLLMQ